MHGKVNKKKSKDEELVKKNVSLLVGIKRGILVPFKCIVVLFCLAQIGIVYIVYGL